MWVANYTYSEPDEGRSFVDSFGPFYTRESAVQYTFQRAGIERNGQEMLPRRWTVTVLLKPF